MNPRAQRRQRAALRLRARADVAITSHACQRAAEHGFSEDDVLTTVASPEQTYGCPAPRYGTDRRTYQRGHLAVVVDERLRLVVTVLPRVQSRWEHATTSTA